MFAHPGFLDLQVNGVAGVDFNDPARSREQVHEAMAAYLGVSPLGTLELEWDLERFELRVARVSSSD